MTDCFQCLVLTKTPHFKGAPSTFIIQEHIKWLDVLKVQQGKIAEYKPVWPE